MGVCVSKGKDSKPSYKSERYATASKGKGSKPSHKSQRHATAGAAIVRHNHKKSQGHSILGTPFNDMDACVSKGKDSKPSHKSQRHATAGAVIVRHNHNKSHEHSILGTPFNDIRKFYTFVKELGRGEFAVTYLCTEKSSGLQYACKSISKRNREDFIKREIQIMQHLSGQHNVVQFKGAYEDKVYVHVVMELCEGGELFDRIKEKGHYNEKDAASLFRKIVSFVHVCHFMGVMHRDLKPENFLFSSNDENAVLKATDFGLSSFIEQGKSYSEIVGSPYYVAPEVLKDSYGKEIDIWSAGVILYILLSGVPPFWGETRKEIFKAVLEGHIDFESDPWPSISNSAKDIISKMLRADPNKRITSAEVLEHEWITENVNPSDKTIDSAILSRMQQFRSMNRLQKISLKVIAENLPEEEIQGVKTMFTNMDTDNNGIITSEELKVGMEQLGTKLTESELQQLIEAVDLDGNGTIDYTEFITATMHRHMLAKDEHLFKAFQYLDRNKNGFITRDDIKTVMKDYVMFDKTSIKEIFYQVDTNSDGIISYKEFCTMMKKGTT